MLRAQIKCLALQPHEKSFAGAVDLQQGEETGRGHNGWDNGLDGVGFGASGSQQVAFADCSKPTGVSASEEQLKQEKALLGSELQRYKLVRGFNIVVTTVFRTAPAANEAGRKSSVCTRHL